MDTFRAQVAKVMEYELAGDVVDVIYGKQICGKRFALVKTKCWWYAVRLIFEDSFEAERVGFFLEESADRYIERTMKELSGLTRVIQRMDKKMAKLLTKL